MVLSFTCFLILVAVPLNLLGLSGPTGILFTALNLGQYAFTIGALSLLAFRVVKLRAALASILLMVQSFMVVEMLVCSINPTSENVVLVLGDLFLSFGVIVLALAANYKILPFVLVALPASAYISCTALIDNEILPTSSLLFSYRFCWCRYSAICLCAIFSGLRRSISG